jgi:hypothetical protein
MRLLDAQYTRTPLNGVRRMTVWLQQQGYLLHPNRMAQLRHTMGAGDNLSQIASESTVSGISRLSLLAAKHIDLRAMSVPKM